MKQIHVPLIRTDALPSICTHPDCLSSVARGSVWCGRHIPATALKLVPSDEIWIYFIQAGDRSVRIGKTHDPAQRLKKLQSENSSLLKLVAAIKARPSLLIDIREMLKTYRLRGEWYKYDSRVIAVIETAISHGVKGLYKTVREHCYMK